MRRLPPVFWVFLAFVATAPALPADEVCASPATTRVDRHQEALVSISVSTAPLGDPISLSLLDPLRRGQRNDLQVIGAAPGEVVRYGGSASGIGDGPCFPALGGLCIDLLPPIVSLGSATADRAGIAVLSLLVPPEAPSIDLSAQALIRRGPGGSDSVKSNAITAPIVDFNDIVEIGGLESSPAGPRVCRYLIGSTGGADCPFAVADTVCVACKQDQGACPASVAYTLKDATSTQVRCQGSWSRVASSCGACDAGEIGGFEFKD